jgi:hypothetical protein
MTTFGHLEVGSTFVFAESPHGDLKRKTGSLRWGFANHLGFLPTAVYGAADREVVAVNPIAPEAERSD